MDVTIYEIGAFLGVVVAFSLLAIVGYILEKIFDIK
jgi:hypothetical protein